MSDSTQSSYDQLADEYFQHIFGELAHKPLDRALLDRFARETSGKICDLGCGPGHVARYLHERGADVIGIDLAPRMVEIARRETPAVEFRQGNMRALNLPDGALGGIAALYSLIHIPREDMVTVLGELRRVLAPGGMLLASFHAGDETRHLEELWGQPISLDFIFYQRAEIEAFLQAAGFEVIEVIERQPYPEVEAQTQRFYVFARKP